MKGTVKFFDSTKGYGFITADDGKEVFVHQSGVEEGLTLRDNDVVSFDIEQGDRGLKAVNVKRATEGAEESSEEAPAQEEEATEESSEDEE